MLDRRTTSDVLAASPITPPTDSAILDAAAENGTLGEAMGVSLVRYDAMCRAIAEAYSIDEVKEIHDKATAMQVYMKQAKNREAERRAAEIRLRAERRVGEFLKDMDLSSAHARLAARRGRGDPDPADAPPSLEKLGVTNTESYKWQQMASIPTEGFEASLKAEAMPTTTGIIRAAILNGDLRSKNRTLRGDDRVPSERHRMRPTLHVKGKRISLPSGVSPDDGEALLDVLNSFDALLGKAPRTVLVALTHDRQRRVLQLAPLVAKWLGQLV